MPKLINIPAMRISRRRTQDAGRRTKMPKLINIPAMRISRRRTPDAGRRTQDENA